jgi:hypothetical protein
MTVISENRTVNSVEARRALLRCFKHKRPVFLWGPPGIGKSELVACIAEDLGGFIIDIRLSQMDPTDLRGIPFYNKDNGKMDWAPPIELPDEEIASKYPIVILFLDEMSSAPQAIQAAAYQLILNRRVGTYKLPNNVVIVAAGNRDSDKGVTYRMPSPLANRFVHLEMRADFDSYLTWAVNNRIHKDVIGYLSFAKGDLFNFDPRSAGHSFATPRSWTFVSELLDEDNDTGLINLVAGAVGEGMAIKFMAHRKISGQMPNPVEILKGQVTELKVKEISAMYSLTISLCYELKDAYDKTNGKLEKWNAMADNFFRFIMDNFNTEMVVMAARVAITTYNIPLVPGKLKHFDEFHQRFGKYIVAAVKVG